MKGIVATIALSLSLPVAAAGLFPAQPVPMGPGYGADGAGVHMARPYGFPGRDCAVNPVSLDRLYRQVSVTEFVPGDVIAIPTTVLFDFDKSFLRPEGVEKVGEVFQRLTDGGVTELRVVGHTDSKGTIEYNEALGLSRAEAVATALADLGFENVTAASAGELEPIAPNTLDDGSDNPDGRQLNRRVTVEVVAVADKPVEKLVPVDEARNPQVFHVLSTNTSVFCNRNFQQDVFAPFGVGGGPLTVPLQLWIISR